MLDTPSDSLTSLYADAIVARRDPDFHHIAFLALWSFFVAADTLDRFDTAYNSDFITAPFVIAIIAITLQTALVLAALALCTFALVRDVRVPYFVNRFVPALIVIVVYVVCAHAAVASWIDRPRAIVVLAAIATAAPRAQLLLLPLFFVAFGDRFSFIARAALGLIAPLITGLCAVCCAFVTIAHRRDGGLLVDPAVIGRLPLLSFLAALILLVWAIAGLLAAWSKDITTMRAHIVSSAPVLIFVVANFSAVQPALDSIVAAQRGVDSAPFGGLSPTAIVILLSTAISLTPFFLARHVEVERVRKAQMMPFTPDQILCQTRFPTGKDPDAVKSLGRIDNLTSFPSNSVYSYDMELGVDIDDESSGINLTWSEWCRTQALASVSLT